MLRIALAGLFLLASAAPAEAGWLSRWRSRRQARRAELVVVVKAAPADLKSQPAAEVPLLVVPGAAVVKDRVYIGRRRIFRRTVVRRW